MGRLARIALTLALVMVALPIGVARSAEDGHRLYLAAVMRPPEPQCGTVRVLDYDGIERDWDWLTATFGDVQITQGDGSACVIELEAIDDGSNTLIIGVIDGQGEPVGGVPAVLSYTTAPLLPPELWGCYDCGDVAYTKQPPDPEAGTCGFGLYAFYWPPAAGPYTVWVGVEGSDCVSGLGMIAATNHYHVDVTYMLTGD